MLRDFGVTEQFAGMAITVPPCLVLATDIFDHFLEENDLRHFAMRSDDDAEIERRFAAATFPAEVQSRLASYLEQVRYPLAVRSSSLLEDSQYQPLAGVYQTYMLRNNHADDETRGNRPGRLLPRDSVEPVDRQRESESAGSDTR